HATGWIQDGIADPADSASALSFGYQGGRTMNTSTLGRVLEQGSAWGFVYFDCCHMASVESIYELRRSTEFIVASVAELPSRGMPYDKTVQHLFASGSPDLTAAARSTFESYDALNGQARTCTMSVLSTSGMNRLAETAAAIFGKAEGNLPQDYTPQKFTNVYTWSSPYFDLRDYLRALCIHNGEERFEGARELYADFEAALADVVVYSAATPFLWNAVAVKEHCGLSTFIMRDSDDAFHKNYNTLGWYENAASRLKFN
ncbi:MAG: hypothetical protein K2F79_01170, partial [Muribaculaceae bacterium]|nr:hypothetical protein [Muribaculaceae bacterium]